MATQTQTAFSVIKTGINKALGSGVYKTMEEMLDLIQAYNQLVEANTQLQQQLEDGINKEKERYKLLHEEYHELEMKLHYKDDPVAEENHN